MHHKFSLDMFDSMNFTTSGSLRINITAKLITSTWLMYQVPHTILKYHAS